MTGEKSQENRQRRLLIQGVWRRWLMLFIPFMAIIVLAMHWLDFSISMAMLALILAATLLYQRFINQRSWRSILWGVHTRDE